MTMPEANSDDRRHYETDAGWRLSLVVGNCRMNLTAPSEDALQGIGLAALNRLASNHWSSKSEIVPLARALGVDVTEGDLVSAIKLAINTAAAL